MFWPDRIASPDYSGLTIEQRLATQTRAMTFFRSQRVVAHSVVIEAPGGTSMATESNPEMTAVIVMKWPKTGGVPIADELS